MQQSEYELRVNRSEKIKQLKFGNAVIQQLSEKCNFCISVFCQEVHKHCLDEVAYFLVNYSAKNHQNWFMCIEVIASQRC